MVFKEQKGTGSSPDPRKIFADALARFSGWACKKSNVYTVKNERHGENLSKTARPVEFAEVQTSPSKRPQAVRLNV